MASLGERLAARTLELVDIPSESGQEAAVREHVRALIPPSFNAETVLEDAALYAAPRRLGVPLLVLAGHYDTVPAQGNLPGQIGGGAVHGLGASDMKGGLAVALELARDLEGHDSPRFDVALLVFGKEELPPVWNPLPQLFDESHLVHETALAVLLEPTAGAVHAGCVGNVNAELVFRGTSGHSARPWLADNAIDRAVAGLATVVAHPRRDVTVEGLTFVEVLSLTRLTAGIADNVIPDEAVAHLNLRFAPDRDEESAVAMLEAITPSGADLRVLSTAPAGSVAPVDGVVADLLASGARGVAPKQAWTNVADFSVRGIDAVNFGPGHPRHAHSRDELVEVAALVHAYETLWRVITGSTVGV
jgi:succinyl-diaminopimelate desuccinylase